jgi:hypothetical protein
VFEQFKDRDHCELSQARKALREYVYGQVAKGETDEKRLVVSGLTYLKQLEKRAAKRKSGLIPKATWLSWMMVRSGRSFPATLISPFIGG